MPTLALTTSDLLNLGYLAAAVLFIFGLKMLSNVKTAPRGNMISALGMLLACALTLFKVNEQAMPGQSFYISLAWIGGAIAVGALIGVMLAVKVEMTGMPQMVALFNGFGGIASLLVAGGDYARAFNKQTVVEGDMVMRAVQQASWDSLAATGLAVLIGGVTFTGSLVAFGKLQGLKITPGRPIQFPGQKVVIGLMVVASLALTGVLVAKPQAAWAVVAIGAIALLLGILLVIGIGGADMPVVISLLNRRSSARPASS